MISYEEYYPYGRSSYRAAASGVDLSLKRYRFTGKERDEETGLDYFGARYYASWLGRWISGDPGGFVDGLNLYRYVRNNPINGIDREGYSTEEVEKPLPEKPKKGKPILDESGEPITIDGKPLMNNTGISVTVEGQRPKTFDFENPWGVPNVGVTPITDGKREEFPVGGPIELPKGFNPTGLTPNTNLPEQESTTNQQANLGAAPLILAGAAVLQAIAGVVEGTAVAAAIGTFATAALTAAFVAGAAYAAWLAWDYFTSPPPASVVPEAPTAPSIGQDDDYNPALPDDGTISIPEDTPIPKKPLQIELLYRALTEEDLQSVYSLQGIHARCPSCIDIAPVSHVAGKRQSPWISTSKNPLITAFKYNKQSHGVVIINYTMIKKLGIKNVDLSMGGLKARRFNAYAKKDAEVLIWQHIPQAAIMGFLIYPNQEVKK